MEVKISKISVSADLGGNKVCWSIQDRRLTLLVDYRYKIEFCFFKERRNGQDKQLGTRGPLP